MAQGSPRLSGREIRAHPHAYLSGHRSSLAGRGECGERGQACARPAPARLGPRCRVWSGEAWGVGLGTA